MGAGRFAVGGRAYELKVAAHVAREAAGEGQAETDAGGGIAFVACAAVKGVEDRGGDGGGNTRTVITHAQDEFAVA